MAVVGVLAEAEVGDDEQVRRLRLVIRIASWTIPSSRVAAEPNASLCSGIPKSRMPGMPSSATSATASPSRSSESWYWPGMDGTSRRRFAPW